MLRNRSAAARIALGLCLCALASCSSTQIAGSEIGALFTLLLGIAILVWLVILFA
jgi:hypothetical protein